MEFEQAVAAGWEVADRADNQPTIDYFVALHALYPDDRRAMFELACAYDFGGQTDLAAPVYERAFAAGLEGERLRRGLLQYGSTLRNLDRADEAVVVLERADVLFPGSDAVRSYLALALLSAGRADEAVANLLDLALDGVRSADFERYEWALRRYAAALRRGYRSAVVDA